MCLRPPAGAMPIQKDQEKTMSTVPDASVEGFRKETDSLCEVEVPNSRLRRAQTQRSLAYFSIGRDLMPREMTPAYAILKKAAAKANHKCSRLNEERHHL